MKIKNYLVFILIGAFSVTLVAGSFGYVALSARAMLVNPRLGTPMRTPAASGNATAEGYLDGTLSIYVGTDPADAMVPRAWLDKAQWEIGFTSTMLDNAPLVKGEVTSIETTSNVFVSYGAGDSSWLSQNAIRIGVRVPASIQPGSYNLHVGFKQALAAANLTIIPGLYQGPASSASEFAAGFVLSEPNCVYVPWVNDSLPSDSLQSSSGYYKPFSMVHLSDIHFGAEADERLQLASSEVYTSAFKDALSIIAPEVMIATGDLTRSPFARDYEYRLAYDWFVSLGIPVIISNGNHDQQNQGLWPYYFGPQTSVVDWANMTFISFNSNLVISGQTASLIAQEVKAATSRGHPVFTACHVPLMDVFGRQTQGSAATIVDAMVRHNGTAILQGHNHYNLVMDAATALDRYLTMGNMADACEFTDLEGEPLPPITGPKMIITSSVGYEGRDRLQQIWESYIPTTSYREIVMVDNMIANYTYDMNGDGSRDATYSTPVFDYTVDQSQDQIPLLNYSFVFDEGDFSAGANYTITNNLTEMIHGARAAIVLPNDQTQDNKWVLDSVLNDGLVIYERSRITNGTHEFIDFRLNVDRWSNVTVHLKYEAI